MLLEEIEILIEQFVIQTIMTETESCLHGTSRHILNHPFDIFWLKVCDAHMTNNTLLLQFHEGWKSLFCHFLQTARERSLKLYVMNINKVYILYV